MPKIHQIAFGEGGKFGKKKASGINRQTGKGRGTNLPRGPFCGQLAGAEIMVKSPSAFIGNCKAGRQVLEGGDPN